MKLKNPFQSAANRLISKEEERQLYEKAGLDIENNNIDKGLWVKALSKAEGDEKKQKGIYIELIVERYKDELRVAQQQSKMLEAKQKKQDSEQEEERRQRYQAKQWEKLNKTFPKTVTFVALLNVTVFIYVLVQASFIGAVFFLLTVQLFFTFFFFILLEFYMDFFKS